MDGTRFAFLRLLLVVPLLKAPTRDAGKADSGRPSVLFRT